MRVVDSSGAEAVAGSNAASALASAPHGPASTKPLVDSMVGAESLDSAVGALVSAFVVGVESPSEVLGSGTAVVAVAEVEKAVVLEDDCALVDGAVGSVEVPLVAGPPVGPLPEPSLHA